MNIFQTVFSLYKRPTRLDICHPLISLSDKIFAPCSSCENQYPETKWSMPYSTVQHSGGPLEFSTRKYSPSLLPRIRTHSLSLKERWISWKLFHLSHRERHSSCWSNKNKKIKKKLYVKFWFFKFFFRSNNYFWLFFIIGIWYCKMNLVFK